LGHSSFTTHTRTHMLVVITTFIILFLCGNQQSNSPHTDPHYISHTCTQCLFAGFCWPVLVMAAVQSHFVAATLGLPTKLGVGRFWLFPASSIKFLTRRNLKSRWVHLSPHGDKRIQLLGTVRSRRWKNNFVVHLKLRQHIE